MTWRFMLAAMGVTAVVVLVLLIPISGFLVQVEHDRITTALERDAFILAGRAEPSLASPSTAGSAAITNLARKYRASSDGARVVVVNAEGTAIVTSDDDPAAVGSSYSSRPEIETALAGQIANGTRYSKTLAFELLYVAVPVLKGDQVLGAVRLTYPAQVVADAANTKLTGLTIVTLTTVLGAGAIGWIFARSVTRRLRRLTELTEHFAEGDLSARSEERSGAPELRSLSRSFNVMAERLASARDQQRRFAADASHQLRTPLTALRLRLERAGELSIHSPEASKERIDAAVAEVDRLETLVEGLLLLSRGEGSVPALSLINLAAVARERVEQWQPLGEERGMVIRYSGPQTVNVLTSPAVAEQIIDNYLDNALNVSPEGGEVTVQLIRESHGATVHVLDQGPGLPPADLLRAFDRFWRGRNDSSGTGLGLAIVSQLAEVGGAEVQLQNRTAGGLDAQVRFTAEWTPERRRRPYAG